MNNKNNQDFFAIKIYNHKQPIINKNPRNNEKKSYTFAFSTQFSTLVCLIRTGTIWHKRISALPQDGQQTHSICKS